MKRHTAERNNTAMKRLLISLSVLLLLASASLAEETLTLSFLGDCSMGEMPAQKGKEGSYTWVLDEKGFDWPFSLVKEWLANDDFTFANNEVVYSTRTRHQDKKTNLIAAPEYAQVYLHSGIDAVNTANNHALDFYMEGYDDTLAALDSFGIPHFGTLYPGTGRERDTLGVYEAKGVKIGAVAFSYPQDTDLKKIQARIDRLRGEGCHLVIVSLHWGREVTFVPQSWQYTYARKVIDMGADVIWGHHPHVLQIVQFYKGKPIFYSTGNFTFGSMSDVDKNTGIFQLTYALNEANVPSLYSFSVVPCVTQGKGDFRPLPLTEEADMQAMREKLVYKKTVKHMTNLPQEFISTGIVYLDGETLTTEKPQ